MHPDKMASLTVIHWPLLVCTEIGYWPDVIFGFAIAYSPKVIIALSLKVGTYLRNHYIC